MPLIFLNFYLLGRDTTSFFSGDFHTKKEVIFLQMESAK